MNAEALIGTVLGSCTLQKLVGQGGMGAVYLAQQSRPRRQVAVKVLLPMTPLSPNQLAAFLERFRRETDAAASLEHPHIMPVYEYGEKDGIAFLVMPYISGGTLRDELEREGQLSMQKVVNYLEQISAALDFAHEHGVIHRDIKPANIMVTTDGRLLLTDFGLVKIVAEGQAPQLRLTGAGAPVGTPDYMSPEQVIGEEIDTRADLYSLGVILYQMITGTTPFQAETPMQIAAQHLQIPPPSPQMLRRDLPIAAEQVILRSLAKRPADRYMRSEDLANAFRTALLNAGIDLEETYTRNGMLMTSSRLAVPNVPNNVPNTPKTQFGPLRPTMTLPRVPATDNSMTGSTGSLNRNTFVPAVTQTNMTAVQPGDGGGLLSRTGKFPMANTAIGTLPSNQTGAQSALNAGTGGGLLSRTGKFPMVGGNTGALPTLNTSAPPSTLQPAFDQASYPTSLHTMTGNLRNQNPSSSSMMKLTGPVKVVKVPVAGQPGRFVTGLLPVSQQAQGGSLPLKPTLQPFMKFALIALTAIVIIGAIGGWLFLTNHKNPTTANQRPIVQVKTTPNPKATAAAQATAAVQANVILTDPLDRNTHNWATTPPDAFAFKNGSYHVTNNQDRGRATILGANAFPSTLGYQLTMQEVVGDDNSVQNSFGMLFRCSQQQKGNTKVMTFYSFEVVNTKGGEYQFWKYDETNADNPWSLINNGKLPLGDEFHQGKGQDNTIKVFMNGDKFTVTVNGKTLDKTFQDGSLTTGTVGMIVHLKGTEVAFKNLILTRN